MKHRSNFRRLLSALLVLGLVLSAAMPAYAAEHTREPLPEPTDPIADLDREAHALTDLVRVSIELDTPGALDRGYAMDNAATNPEAIACRAKLRAAQDAVQAKIEAATGSALNVKWHLTLCDLIRPWREFLERKFFF